MSRYYCCEPSISNDQKDRVDWTLTLCKREMEDSTRVFYAYLVDLQEKDPENFYCAEADVCGDKFMFLITEHPDTRRKERSEMSRWQLQRRCMEIVQNSCIGAAITQHPCKIGDNGKVSCTNGVGSTVVVDEATGLTLVFECGFSFIRLVTLWQTGSIQSHIRKRNR